jgi:DNA polymerase-1
MNRLIIIDGHAILHRAFHAIPPLTTSDGTLVNAVYGFASMLLRIVEDFHPTHLMVCFDRPKPTIKKQMYVGYHAKRPKMDEGLSSQISLVHDLLTTMGVSMYELDGYEADDVMGTIVEKVKTSKKIIDEVIIVTGDRDILQLVSDKVKVCMPIMGLTKVKLYGVKDVVEKFGITPTQMVDYKALVGDQSDNYPGVPGIGPKTAKDLLERYTTLENLYTHIGELKNERVKKILAENTESAALGKKLAAMLIDAPVEINFDKSQVRRFDSHDIMAKFEEYGFRSLIPRLMGSPPPKKTVEKPIVEKKEDPKKNQMSLF